MKFWEMESILREDDESLERVLRRSKWEVYLERHQHYSDYVEIQHREILDEAIAEELAEDLMLGCQLRFVVRNDHLYLATNESGSFSASVAYQRFGATAMEEVLEKGALMLRPN